MIRKLAVLVVVPFLLLLTPAHAQSTRLEGIVKSRLDQPVQGVTMTIGNYSVVTDRGGRYAFDYLRPGRYVVTVSPRGKRPRAFPVVVTTNPTRVDFRVDW